MFVSPVANGSAAPTQGSSDTASLQQQLTALKKKLDKIKSCTETAKAEQTQVKLLEAQIQQKQQQIQKLQTTKPAGTDANLPSQTQADTTTDSTPAQPQGYSAQSFEAFA
jgi:hypothetical protein